MNEPDDRTDSQLIARFLAGDMTAFNRLVYRWQPKLFAFANRYLNDGELAVEVCHKAFIRVYHRLADLKQHRKFSTWLFQIAVNLCRDELKARKRRAFVDLDSLNDRNNGKNAPHVVVRDPNDPERQAWSNDAQRVIQEALHQIPAAQREVIIMKEYEGLKFREIAEILGLSENTVKARMYYGLEGLRKVFKQWQIDRESLSHDM